MLIKVGIGIFFADIWRENKANNGDISLIQPNNEDALHCSVLCSDCLRQLSQTKRYALRDLGCGSLVWLFGCITWLQ